MATRYPPTDTDESVPSSLGEMIRLAREEKGWTQVELAKRAGLPQNSVNRWEKGKVITPREDSLLLLSDVLGISPSWLFEGTRFRGVVLPGTALRKQLASIRSANQRRFLEVMTEYVLDKPPDTPVEQLLEHLPVEQLLEDYKRKQRIGQPERPIVTAIRKEDI
jgi:transcriptional regulator with XRE-family HTH domain